MATFNDLAIELQLAIWQFVLPYRGIHWVEIEGLPHEASYLKDTIRFTRQRCPDGKFPETLTDFWELPMCDEHRARFRAENQWDTKRRGVFFQKLLPVTPSVWGEAGPAGERADSGLAERFTEELEYTRRCRQLSTYTQVTTLLSTCHLSRTVALEYAQEYLLSIYRSKGLLYRPRSLNLWEAQYLGNREPDFDTYHFNLVPVIRQQQDLVVLRLHDVHGRATPLLHDGLYQFSPESHVHGGVFPWIERVGIEWHPRWATPGPDGREQFQAAKVQAMLKLMHAWCINSTLLYWLVDGVPRPNWERDYHPVVPYLFNKFTTQYTKRSLRDFTGMDEETRAKLAADCGLNIEFEANGRRYYLVFVVIHWDRWVRLPDTFMSIVDGPFIYGETNWPEAVRAPARYPLNPADPPSLGPWKLSFILSWEPV
ncbi:hypothetical protein N0V93_004123 [Gnomoniopsis smithogilvyi]|uniref:Uncharacterized protein n=1 Tax=Gnomoniopsis smithogilvyi TaxID=1191159 RepID=A0A9W9D0Q2_9PEZI|nr:hypothetical protein N0V93_004123 [Gnomoniopsis smithogilvyi]